MFSFLVFGSLAYVIVAAILAVVSIVGFMVNHKFIGTMAAIVLVLGTLFATDFNGALYWQNFMLWLEANWVWLIGGVGAWLVAGVVNSFHSWWSYNTEQIAYFSEAVDRASRNKGSALSDEQLNDLMGRYNLPLQVSEHKLRIFNWIFFWPFYIQIFRTIFNAIWRNIGLVFQNMSNRMTNKALAEIRAKY